jgi:2-dehydropantoate 2-reductase
MRFVVYGAGAIGGAIGAGLHRSGHDVALIARGRQLQALQARGVTVQTPAGEVHADVRAVGAPSELAFTAQDVVVLAMKSQDTAHALDALAQAARPDVAVVCAQNGVENERLALRRFARVYGMFVWAPAQLLEPAVIQVFSAPALGVLDLGRAAGGSDERAQEIARALSAAGFASRPDAEIMRWKYGKLLSNLANAVEALLGPDARGGEFVRLAREEALRCYAVAGIRYADREEIAARAAGNEALQPVDGRARSGGSTWQSLARESGSVETAYLNGEIVLLGRTHGLATPVNGALAELALRAAADRAPPGSLTEREIERAISRQQALTVEDSR